MGLGGFDIYYCVKDNLDNNWSAPVNLGYPINSPYNDFGISRRGNIILISSNRDGTFGGKDIFEIEIKE